MICPMTDSTTREWSENFRAHASQSRTPIAATLELTRRCPFQCAHCYLGDQHSQQQKAHQERTTEQVKTSLREWADAGCLYLTLTGGDPMIRPDFQEIYRFSRELGMVVSVFCTGSWVTEEIVSLFQEIPPRKVEISIYGATAETFAVVTGVSDAKARVWRGIQMLQEAGVPLGLKTLLLTTNQHEFEAMEKQASHRDLPFRHDAALFPCLEDGSKAPLAFRVSPERAVECDLAGTDRRQMWREKIERTAAAPEQNRVYLCSAGLTSFHADPFGNLYPCLLASDCAVSGIDLPFQEVWEQELGAIRERVRIGEGGSFTGPQRGACTHCPAFNRLETGDEEQESDYMKETTRLRFERVMKKKTGDGS